MSSKRIVDAGYRVLRGTLAVPRTAKAPMYCLAFVRIVVEQAFDLAPGEFYERWVDNYFFTNSDEVIGKDISPRWARGAERAMRPVFGIPLEQALPGDLVFSYKVSKPYGHVGILMPGKMVLENTAADRGWRHPEFGAIRHTPLRLWDPVTTVVRIPEGR